MPTPLRVLILEDQPADAEMALRELRQAGFDPEWQRVETEKEYLAALHPALDIILSDYSLPQFDGLSALRLLRARGLDLPFILISGTIGEDIAVESLKLGADDYLMKDRLTRLGPAVKSALEQKRLRGERQQAEETLLASEKRFRSLIEHSLDSISLLGPDGALLWESPSSTQTLGYAQDAFIGHNMFDLVHPQDLEPIRAQFAEIVQKPKSSASGLYRLQDSSGSWRWIEMVATNLLDEPSVNAIVVNYRDVTERKRADQALADSEARYRQAITAADAIPYSLNYAPHHYTFMGEGITKFVGHSVAEITPTLLNSFIVESIMHGRFKGVSIAEAMRLVREGESRVIWQCEHRIRTRSGEERWLFDSSIQILDEHNIPTGSVGILQDITERKLAEKVMLENEARYRSLFEDSPISLWEEDFSAVKLRLDALRNEGIKDFRAYFASHPQTALEYMSLVKIVDVNKATLKLYGAKRKADLFQDLGRFINDDADQLFQNELISIAQGKTQFEWDGVSQTLDGRQIIIRLGLSVMQGYEDTFSKVIISMVDITAHMQAEIAIRESERSLRESQMIAGLGSYVVDFQSRTWTGSHILKQIFGIDESYNYSIEGWYEIVHPDLRQEMSDYFANEVLGKHMRFDKEYRIVRKNDGAERWVHALGELETDTNNQPVKMRGTIQDITARKLDEIEIQERTDDMELINSLNEETNRGESLDYIFKSFSQKLHQISRYQGATFYLLSPDGKNLVMQNLDRSQNSIKKIEQLIRRQIPLLQIPIREGKYFDRILHSEKDVLTTDPEIIREWITEFAETSTLPKIVRAPIRKLIPQIFKLLNIRSTIIIRLVSDKKVFGLFDVPSAEILTERDLNRIQIISNQLTAVILRKQAEEALSRSRDLLNLTGRMAQIGGWDLDLELQTLTWTEEVYRIHEVDPSIKPNVAEAINFYAPEAQPIISAAVQTAIEAGTPWDLELELITAKGRRIWVRAQGAAERQGGKTVRIFGAFHEITERKRAEEDRLARESAERANLAKSEFLSRMSHELRTPMNSILGFTQLLKMDELSPDQMGSLDQILRSGKHLLNLINEVLDISRIESGEMPIWPEPVQVPEALKSAAELIRPLADQRGIRIFINTPSSQDTFVTADRQRFNQVLLNLLSNAVKYNRENGEINITTSLLVDGYLHLAVRDTGNGIPPEKMERLFTPFDRLELDSGMVEGTGLGLALSKGLVEAMGGRIGAQSVVGEGSTFWLDLKLTLQQ